MNSENNQTSTTPQPGQANMCSVSGENMPVATPAASPMLIQQSGNVMNPHQATPPTTPLAATPQGGAPTPTPSSTPSPMPPPMQNTMTMQPSQQMQTQNASPATMCSQSVASQPMCSQPMVSQAMCPQPMVSQAMCSNSASQAMGSIAGSVAMSAPVYSMTHMTQMPVSQSMCSIPVSTPICSIPQQNMTNTTISNVHPSSLPQVQVIQQPLHNQTYLQHLYAPQQQMILPGNLTIQPAMASTLQNLGAAQGLSLQLQQGKANIDHKGQATGGATLIPASSMQGAENYMENYQSLHNVSLSTANLVSASGQMISTAAKTCMPGQMLTAAARSTMLQGQAGFAQQAGGQTVMIGQLGMLSNQPSLMPSHNKALAEQQKGKSFIMNQQATLQPKSPILPQPVTSGQVLSSTQLKQLSSNQLITSQAPATMLGGHLLALGSLPQGITWTAAGGLQQSALLTQNPIFFRSQQSDMFIQSPTQTMHAVPVAATAAAQANVQPAQMQQQVAKPKQPKQRNRTHARSVGVQQQVMPRPLIPQMATTQTQTQTQATHIAPQTQHQQLQQQHLHQQHQNHHHQQQQQQQQHQQHQQQQNQLNQNQQHQNQLHQNQHHHNQHQFQQHQKADACNQTRPATEMRVASIQMKTTSTSTSMEPKNPTTAQKIEACTMGFVNIAPAPPPQVSVAPVNIVVAQSHKMVTASTNTSPTHQSQSSNNNNIYTPTNTIPIAPVATTIHLPPPPPPPPIPPIVSVTASTNTEKRPLHPPQMVSPQIASAAIAPHPQVSEDKTDANTKENSSIVANNRTDDTSVQEKRSTGTGDGDVNVTTAAEAPVKEKQPQKAIVKPHVLTHVIEGYIIQEGSEPFPVTRSSLLTDNSPSKLNSTNNEKPVEEDSVPTAKEASSNKVTKKKKTGLSKRKNWRKMQNNRHSYNVDEWQQGGQNGPESNHVLITTMNLGDDSMDGIITRKIGGNLQGSDQEVNNTSDSPSGPESSVSPTTPCSNREDMEVDIPEGASIFNSKNPIKWTVQDVVDFVRNLPGCSDYADEFRSQEIDGQALLLLKEDHLMTAMSMKLGPALKICARINNLREESNRQN